jgi:hypothetical protein
MLKRIALYPFLFVLFVILNPLINNMDELDPVLALRPLVILLLVAAGLFLLFRAIFKNWHYAGYLSFLLLFLIFIYGHVMNIVTEKLPEEYAEEYPWGVFAVLLIMVILLGWNKTWNRLGGPFRVTPFLNLVLTIAIFSQGLVGIWELARRSPGPSRSSRAGPILPETGAGATLDCSISPDIYWIILDGYGRADVLEEIYGVDTTGFLTSLQQKGFFIAEQSHSNYIQTVYSIPSAMNFTYLDPMPANVSGYDYFPELIAKNRLMALLRQCGYRMVTFETGFFFTNYPDADEYHSIGFNFNEFEGLLLASTPLEYVVDELDLEPLARSYEAHRGRVHFTFDNLAELPGTPGPKFAYAHIISPHPPFVFDASGDPVQPRRGYSIGDGNDYRGSWEEYREGYAAQVQYVNQLIEETVSEIIQRSPRPPVIVIQGDHGPGGLLEWKSPYRTCLWERTSILNAYYLPEGGSQYLSPDITPVNSFRVVLNAYFGTDLALLPGETYFTSHLPGGDFIDVTDRRESRANCGS